MNPLRRWYAPAFLLLAAASAHAQPAKPPDAPAEEKWLLDRTLTLEPRAEPRPALAYRLFPVFTERKEGNAVPIYLRVNFEQNDAARREWRDTPQAWNELPIDKVPVEEAKKWLDKYRNFFRQFELAARRQSAEWNYTLDQGSIIDVLLPDVQSMRGFLPMMVLKVRVEIAQGNFAAAAHWLETGFSFSQQVGQGPFLINRLVGIACASQFEDCVLDFITRPGAPNLYWPLAALPRPLIDLRDALELEQQVLEMQFPDLNELDQPRTAEHWDAVLKKVRHELQRLNASPNEAPGKNNTPAGMRPDDPASKSPDLERARKHLVEFRKLAAEKVNAMPPAQVLLIYLLDMYHVFRDDLFKGSYLPYPESKQALADAQARRKEAPNTEAKGFADALLPAISKVHGAQTRIDRKVAALRVIEALRIYAAAHAGQLPDKLSEVREVPVPDDPATGKPFAYERSGDTATLTGRIPGEKVETTGLRYRLTMKK